MPTAAITDYTFPNLNIKQMILFDSGFELRSGNDKQIPALQSLVAHVDAVITQFAPINADVIVAPHIASACSKAIRTLRETATKIAVMSLRGEPLLSVVNDIEIGNCRRLNNDSHDLVVPEKVFYSNHAGLVSQNRLT